MAVRGVYQRNARESSSPRRAPTTVPCGFNCAVTDAHLKPIKDEGYKRATFQVYSRGYFAEIIDMQPSYRAATRRGQFLDENHLVVHRRRNDHKGKNEDIVMP